MQPGGGVWQRPTRAAGAQAALHPPPATGAPGAAHSSAHSAGCEGRRGAAWTPAAAPPAAAAPRGRQQANLRLLAAPAAESINQQGNMAAPAVETPVEAPAAAAPTAAPAGARLAALLQPAAAWPVCSGCAPVAPAAAWLPGTGAGEGRVATAACGAGSWQSEAAAARLWESCSVGDQATVWRSHLEKWRWHWQRC